MLKWMQTTETVLLSSLHIWSFWVMIICNLTEILHNFRILAWRIFYINNCNYYLPANNNAVCANLTSILLGLNKRCVVATQNGLAGPFLVINLAIKCRKRANYLWSSIYGESVLIFQGIIKVFTYLQVQYYLDQDISVPLVA